MSPKEVRRARKRLGLTLDQMAAALDIDRQTWWRWEHGVRIPPPFLWRAIEHLEAELRTGQF